MQGRRGAYAPGNEAQVTFKVRLTRDAEADLNWLFDVLLECRQSRDDDDLNLPTQAVAALQSGMATLRTAPFTSRKTGQSLFPREQAMSSDDLATWRCPTCGWCAGPLQLPGDCLRTQYLSVRFDLRCHTGDEFRLFYWAGYQWPVCSHKMNMHSENPGGRSISSVLEKIACPWPAAR